MKSEKLIIAIDTTDMEQALTWTRAVVPHCGMIKIGMEFFAGQGLEGLKTISTFSPRPIMFDLKLHDIPETVARTVRAVLPLRPRMITVHATGGPAMIEAAVKAAKEGDKPPLILAVLALTSQRLRTDVLRDLTYVAGVSGTDGFVCSPGQARYLKKDMNLKCVKIACPGIRMPGQPVDDHLSSATPADAIRAGADWLVVGRPITHASDPAAEAERFAREIENAIDGEVEATR